MRPFYDLTVQGRARRLRQLALNALTHYALDVTRVRLLSNDMNGIFRVDTADGRRLVLRVAVPGDHTADQFRAEMAWLEALGRDTDLPIPAAVRARDGSLIVTEEAPGVPEPRHCMIFTWVPGRNLADQLSPDTMRLLGELTARLHLHAADYHPAEGMATYRYDRVFFYAEPLIMYDDDYAHLLPPERRALFQQAQRQVEAAIERLKASGEPVRLLHGDLHDWNVKIFRGRAGAIDFEDLFLGWPIQDIATSLYYFFNEPDYEPNLVAYRHGYERCAPWPERHPGEMRTFMAGRLLLLANFVIQDDSPEWRAQAPALFERWEGRLHRLLDF
jgi:Ser/Thr protein kinase RdoA (MazF antagonist)